MDEFIAAIQQFNSNRLPDMVGLKYQLMLENMFRFYRGTCFLFYDDLHKETGFPSSPLSWISGDLHLENFGSYKGDNRLVYFDLNDFDEAVLAPALWEVARTLTSIFIAFKSMDIDEEKAIRMAQLFMKNYACTLANGKAKHLETKTANGIVCDFLQAVRNRKYRDVLSKRTIRKKDRLAILLDDVRHKKLDKDLKKELKAHMNEWIKTSDEGPYHYSAEDVVFRIAGTGSMGVKRYAFLLKSERSEGKYLLLDMKQAVPSGLTPYLNSAQPQWNTEAERVVAIQKRMQNVSPALLSTTVFKGESYIIQEMHPEKDNFNFKFVKDRYRDMYQVIDDMAMLTASAQLRSSGRQGSAIADELIELGNSDHWQEPLLNYCMKECTVMADRYMAFQKAYSENAFPPTDLHS
ncbi:DUF2252 domain-containing protein [Filimonas effusa]|uniref:DUF2252 domain-containing protein n=1 Tax=Filimonas effusa TaxID=2508721 RepID=A0A4Q1D8S5_9BACT|nr:DUF2252 family protein [Filimonas effusa]RXK85764.1 DUF2252 domain-containing protein [Filimonas effusa]